MGGSLFGGEILRFHVKGFILKIIEGVSRKAAKEEKEEKKRVCRFLDWIEDGVGFLRQRGKKDKDRLRGFRKFYFLFSCLFLIE